MPTKIKAQFPRRMRVGKKMYSVEIVEAMLDKKFIGNINFDNQRIAIASRHPSTGRLLAGAEVRDSFWHELVHAILHDMGRHNLNRDEGFVTGFANRLSKAIDSARF
jgi:exoribonuclease II